MPPYFQVTSFIFFIAYCGCLIWCWVAWIRLKPKALGSWRVAAVPVGILCATISVTLSVFLYIHALYTGGYPFYHPVELRCIRWGTLTALLGIIAAIVGKGRGRIPLAVISVLNLAMWFADAMAQ
jgi:hypothetical protein